MWWKHLTWKVTKAVDVADALFASLSLVILPASWPLCPGCWSCTDALLSGALPSTHRSLLSAGAAVSLKAWVGLEWLSPKTAHSHGCWQEASFFFLMYLFVLGWAESLLLNRLVSSYGEPTLWWCKGFSLQWLLLLRSTGSRATGSTVVLRRLRFSQHVESSWIKDRTCVFCIGRQILYHWTTREAQGLVFLSQWLLHRTASVFSPCCGWFPSVQAI